MKFNSRGQLLIESLVAITVIAIAILGIFTLSSRSISLNRVVSDQYTATYLAAEGIEVIKNIIDTNVVYDCQGWNTGVNVLNRDYSVDYKTDDSSALPVYDDEPVHFEDGLYSRSTGEPTKFFRKVRLEQGNNANSLKVISTVEWENRGGATFDVVLEDVFYDWRPFADNCI